LENAHYFKEKIRRGEICLGTALTINDPTVTEALCPTLDFIWVDMEHNAFSLESVQAHLMATKGSTTTPLVRVAWNDPVLIKPVLDIGAAGIVVPMIRTAADTRLAVAACRYPPEGIRGYGPRRPSNFGRLGGPEFCKAANEAVMVIIQIEHIDAVNNIDEILAVPGVTSILIGSNDLSGSMGHMGEPRHPEVLRAIDKVIEKTRKTDVFVGIAIAEDPVLLNGWVDKGVQWLSMGNDYSLLLRSANQVASAVREHAKSRTTQTAQ
jgi:2-dehydro-3-deoxyglucarate aldolase/4-hydroxy-2-oxoheptanedioate aldolase